MSIPALIDLGIGPGATIRFVITGGLGGKSAAGAISAAVIGKKKKDARQWHTLPNGMRILATPENYQRFARKYPKVEETPAEPSAPAPVAEEVAGSPPAAQPESVAEPYEGPLLGETPKREFVSKEARGDAASLAAAAQAMAAKLAAAQLAREIEEEDDAIVLELLLKDMAA